MFKVGDIVKTRSGVDAEILKTDLPGQYPIVAVVNVQGSVQAIFTLANGETGNVWLSPYDLMPPEEFVWVNVYLSKTASGNVRTSSGYSSRHLADLNADPNRGACVKVKIGQFDE